MIGKMLENGGIKTGLECTDWKEVCRTAGQILLDAEHIKPAYIDSMIETVHQFGPYMILVPKVCFFHGTPGDLVNEPCLSLCLLKEPVYFTNYDNQQINCAFAFGAKDKDSHLGMLMELAKLLSDQSFIDAITSNQDADYVLKLILEKEEKNEAS